MALCQRKGIFPTGRMLVHCSCIKHNYHELLCAVGLFRWPIHPPPTNIPPLSPLLNPAWLRGNQLERYYWRTSAQAQWERECFHVGWRKEWRTCAAVIHSHVESGRFQGEAQNKCRTEQRDSHMQITLISLLERSTSKSPRKDTCQATCLL